MRKMKLIQLLVSLLGNLGIKNKKVKVAIVAVIGLAIGGISMMDEDQFGKDVDKLTKDPTAIEKVVKEEAGNAVEDFVGGLLKSLF